MSICQTMVGLFAGGICGYVCLNRCSQQSYAISHYMRGASGGQLQVVELPIADNIPFVKQTKYLWNIGLLKLYEVVVVQDKQTKQQQLDGLLELHAGEQTQTTTT
eukprot:GHVS01080741.1.p2 GENE.GHVS01080741.1~~GHVS01080741.1.p2  ORF type:complete len:105 (-),score=28.97 GHVS01080741.1:416-730(-)